MDLDEFPTIQISLVPLVDNFPGNELETLFLNIKNISDKINAFILLIGWIILWHNLNLHYKSTLNLDFFLQEKCAGRHFTLHVKTTQIKNKSSQI